MPATFGIEAVSIAGMARSYATRLSLFVLFPPAEMGVSGNPSVFSICRTTADGMRG